MQHRSHLSKFQLETLFYIFYAMPKDVSNLRRVNKQNGSRIGSSAYAAQSCETDHHADFLDMDVIGTIENGSIIRI